MQVLSAQPAELAGVGHRKGMLAVGYDADITVRGLLYMLTAQLLWAMGMLCLLAGVGARDAG